MWEGRHNFQLNSATVLRDLYRLISMVVADHGIIQESEGQDDPLLRLRDQFLEDEFVHLLVGTAVTNRIQEEHMRGLRNAPGELGFRPLVHECGSLQPDVRREGRIGLGFREACNKIIHAVQIIAENSRRSGSQCNAEHRYFARAAWRRRVDCSPGYNRVRPRVRSEL